MTSSVERPIEPVAPKRVMWVKLLIARRQLPSFGRQCGASKQTKTSEQGYGPKAV